MEQILAWHFCNSTLRDGSPIPDDGVWLKHKGPLVICESGLHASINPFDALQYAPGPILCRVAVRGEIIHQEDKLVASERMIIYRMDATELLRYYARMQALSVIHLWDAPDIVLDYLMTGDESIRAAAWDAAWDAAGDAAGDAAEDVVMAAAGDAAWAAAWAAVRAAAWDAAGDAVRAAAWAAAWDAAGDAAWAAAWAAARKEFTDFVNECFRV